MRDGVVGRVVAGGVEGRGELLRGRAPLRAEGVDAGEPGDGGGFVGGQRLGAEVARGGGPVDLLPHHGGLLRGPQPLQLAPGGVGAQVPGVERGVAEGGGVDVQQRGGLALAPQDLLVVQVAVDEGRAGDITEAGQLALGGGDGAAPGAGTGRVDGVGALAPGGQHRGLGGGPVDLPRGGLRALAARGRGGPGAGGVHGGGPGLERLAPGALPGAVGEGQAVVEQPAGQLGEGDGVLVGGEHRCGAERAGEVLGAGDRLEQPCGAAGADDLHEAHRAVVVAGADHGPLAGAVGDDDGAGVRGEHPGEAGQPRVGAGLEHGDLAGRRVQAARAQRSPRGLVGELERQAAAVIGPGAAHAQPGTAVLHLRRDR